MKQKLSGFVAGIITTVIIASLTITALATSGKVSFNIPNIQLNLKRISATGESYTLNNNCEAPSSITYTDEKGGDTTYLPVRRISELIGVTIGYDGETKSVMIGEQPASATPSDDYSKWTAEEEAEYQAFVAMWDAVDVGDVINPNETYRLFRADYNGSLTKDELLRYLQGYNRDALLQYCTRMLFELISPLPEHLTAFTFTCRNPYFNIREGVGEMQIDSNGNIIKFTL